MKNEIQQMLQPLLENARQGTLSLQDLISHAEQLKSAAAAQEAIQLYKVWIASTASDNQFVAFFNLGVLLAEQGEWDSAVEAYQNALKARPDLHQARINLGLTLERQGFPEQSLAMWSQSCAALAKDPSNPMYGIALNHIGRVQENQRQYPAAEEALRQSLAANPRQSDAIQHWVHLRQKQCKWPALSEQAGLSINALIASTSPLAMLALHDDPALQWLCSQNFLQRKFALKEGNLGAHACYQHGRLRIGYVSGDLCTSAVGLLMADLIEAHDRSQFEIFAFDFSPRDGTAYQQRLHAAFEHVIDIRNLPDANVAQLVKQLEVDVLIDLHGLSSGARPAIFAARPAPLQGTYLGFIGTTAMPWLDFVIADHFSLPPALEPYFVEKPLRLSGSFLPLHHQPLPAHSLTRAKLGLPENAFVMACFNNIYKLTQPVMDAWIRALKDHENACLWLLDDNPSATQQLKQYLAQAGVPPHRYVFSPRSSHLEYRQRLTLADLYLDTYPYNAGSTARDVMDAGLPLLTLSGQTFISRMAGSLLHHAGLNELICDSLPSYEERLRQLMVDPAQVKSLKKRLKLKARHWKKSPQQLASSLERQLKVMYSERQADIQAKVASVTSR
jgi:predicted O-linked N-acetylglucosamine transferase (SPINDLY family)